MKRFRMNFSTVLAIALMLTVLLVGNQPLQADVITVCTEQGTCDYTTIQEAVDAADDGDIIKVATGTYTGVSTREGVTQVVYLSKSVTIRGGYTADFTDPPDPEANPTILNAEGNGRVLYITGETSPIIEGLHIAGGDAAGLGGDPWGNDAGGGVYVINATATISNNQVLSNTASHGGGLYLYSSATTLTNNVVTTNTANYQGGGLHLYSSAATLSNNTISSNIATSWGGGLSLFQSSAAMLSNNAVIFNTTYYSGGGLYLSNCDPILSGNTITDNSATGFGGGLSLSFSQATLSNNSVFSNTAYYGGGLSLDNYSHATLSGNTITDNTASSGGGVYLYASSNASLVNNLVTNNHASIRASGIDIVDSSPRLLHTTIARNTGGDGTGVYIREYPTITGYSDVTFTNTILVGHAVGVRVTNGNTAELEGTLWGAGAWANSTDWEGEGTINIGTVNHWSDPAFVDADAGDYHICEDSGARDTGVDAGVTTDMDGELRPCGEGHDIGADEWMPPSCEGDFDEDGDVDGSDLAIFASGETGISPEKFAADFGRTNCPQ